MTQILESNEVADTSLVPAPHGLRVGAWIIDCLVIAIVFAALPQPLPVALMLVLLTGYHAAFLWLTQQTVGKALLGVRVRRIGREPALIWAIGRSSLGYFAVDLLGAGLLMALFNREHRTLHDLVFGSVVTVDESGRLTARNLLSRFVAFCERQSEALKARKKVVGILGAFWAFLMGLGRGLKSAVDYVTRLLGARADTPPTSSILKALSAKIATVTTTAATAATAAVFVAVPQARELATWLLEPRYFLTDPPAVISTFDNDAEAWKVLGDAQGDSDDPTHDSGAVRATDDQSGGTWYFQAPAAFLGNKLHLYERELRFKLKVDDTDNPYVEDDLVLEGGGLTLVHDLDAPAVEWTSYRIRLDESAAWVNRGEKRRATREEVRQVLGDMRRLLIRGEFRSGPDTGWLDDVTLGAEPVARIARVEVPESIISGTDAPLAVTYSGDLRFPVRLIYRPRSCPPGYNCRTEEKAFTAAPDDARLVGERFVRCLTAGADPWAMDFEAVLKDSAGIEIARPAPVVCQPAR